MEMVEAVASSEEGTEMGKTEEDWKTKELSFPEVVKWERNLPRMVLRVLLVEADDSTRQIIAALLRKCSYRVVAVPDGLEAWEKLKQRPQNIDLILSEVELPSISGYALLTLIMEHELCRSIPVIMMSSQDSISVVLKCMLKGAADFLIKPVRKNELRNLWQHVWRRQTNMDPTGSVPETTAIGPQKVEVTSQNNAAGNHSSDLDDDIPKNKECSEKASDAQSTCTTPNLEAESTYVQNMQGLLQLTSGSGPCLVNPKTHEESMNLVEKSVTFRREVEGKSIGTEMQTASGNDACTSSKFGLGNDRVCVSTVTWGAHSRSESHSLHANNIVEVHCHTDDLDDYSRGALDLIGNFEDRPMKTSGNLGANDGTNKLSCTPELELSLRRFHPSYPKNETTDDRHVLNHSNGSAFSRYSSSKASQVLFPVLTSNLSKQEERATTLHNNLSDHAPENSVSSQSHGERATTLNNKFSDHAAENSVSSQSHGAALSHQENRYLLFTGQSGHHDAAFPFPGPQLGFIPVPGVKLDNYGQIFPPIFYGKIGLPPLWSPKGQHEQSPFLMSSSRPISSEIQNSEQDYCSCEETTNHSAGQPLQQDDKNVEYAEVPRLGSPTCGRGGVGNSCSGPAVKLNSGVPENMCDESNSAATSDTSAARTTSECLNDSNFPFQDGLRARDSHCSSQREAALLKFRMKRKDRCYEKKVRYQSRKRLAEQRPRVRGQFVREMRTDAPPPES